MTPNSSLPRILAIHAHPDDIELQCAGTLFHLKQQGCPIVLATMTPGDCGSAELLQDAIAAVRRLEAQRAADLLGSPYHCLEFRDLCIVVDNDSRRRVTEFLRTIRPDVVITAPPIDYMSDHEMTSRLVRDACFNASCPNYDTQHDNPAPATTKIPHLYYVDALEGIDSFGNHLPVDFVVDVTSTFDQKLQMLACHESQRSWLQRQHGIDEYLESCRRWCQIRGREINVAFGEAFTQHRGHAYPHDNLLDTLLKGLVKETLSK